MRRSLIWACLYLLSASLVSAQTGGALCLFSDPDGNDCSINDPETGLVTVYVVHTQTDAVTASRFSVPLPSCANWTYIGEMSPFSSVIGNSQTGISVAYGECLSAPVHVLTMHAFSNGGAEEGCPLEVRPDPEVGYVQGVNCNTELVGVSGGTTFINSDLPCVCTTNENPVLYVGPLVLDFSDWIVARRFTIANGGGGTLTWDVSEAISWLDASPTSGSGSASIQVTVDRTGLPAGNYSGAIDVLSNAGNETVTVNMTVAAPEPILGFTPASLAFGPEENDKILTVFNAGTGHLDWYILTDVSWLTASPPIGDNDAEVTVHVDRTDLPVGTHEATLLVESNGGEGTVPVTVEVAEPNPVLYVTPDALWFPNTLDELFLSVSNVGTGDLEWSVEADQTWLSADPASGTNDATVFVQVDRTGLADGGYEGNLSVTSNGGDATIPVDMWVGPQPILSLDPTVLFFSPTDSTDQFTITNAGEGTLEWAITWDETWIDVVPPLEGTGDATITVNVDPASVPPGARNGYVTVTSNGGTASVEVRYLPPGSQFGGSIGVYVDEYGYDCNIVDSGGLLSVYVVHTNVTGAVAAQFAAPAPACMHGVTWVTDSEPIGLYIGNSQTGIAVAYGSCLSSPIRILTITYVTTGSSETCCPYPVIADPHLASGEIEVVNCAESKVYATGLISSVNADGSCRCGAVVVKEATWGEIKALYGPR